MFLFIIYRMNLKKLLQFILLIIALIFISQNVKQRVIFYPLSNSENFPSDPYYTYSIEVFASGNGVNTNSIFKGFCDALNDQGLKDNLAFDININYSYGYPSALLSFNKQIGTHPDLFFTIGKPQLDAALTKYQGIPIVSAGAMDFSKHISISSRNRVIRNFTGVSGLPNTEFLLSTILETVPYLDKIGIIYGENENPEAIYQNTVLKDMLDEANISWIDYTVPKYESNDSIQNDDAEFEDEEDKEDRPTFNDVIADASITCDCLFIPSNSSLSDNAGIITDISLSNGAITFSNDPYIGLDTYCSTYTDPYDQGYNAGKEAYIILTENTPVTEIEISDITWEKSYKLYNRKYLELYPKEFPKSFSEINSFLSVYREGSRTSRIK